MVPQFQGDYCRHNYYTMEWNGRNVHLDYSKLNGCGRITFGFTTAEAEEATRRRAEEKRQEDAERMERKRKWTAWARENAPEKLEARISRYRSKIADLQEGLDDIREAMMEWEAEGDTKMVDLEKKALENTQKELAEAEAMLAIYL